MGRAAAVVVAVIAALAAACTDATRVAPSTDPAAEDALGPTVDESDDGATTAPEPPTVPDRPTLPPLPAPTTAPPPPEAVTVSVVGNLSDCGDRNREVAALIDGRVGPLLSTGDLTVDGTAASLNDCFLPLYGDDLDRLYAVPGDGDLATDNGAPFFGLIAQTPTGSTVGKGWFVTTIGAWQVIGLTSRCADVGGCGEGSEQYQWLDSLLRAQPSECRLALWHDPRFTSAEGVAEAGELGRIYGRLEGAGTDLVVTGGPANYERLGPLRPDGDPSESGDDGAGDTGRGIVNINVGTGGVEPTEFGDPRVGSRARTSHLDGVLSLRLAADGYQWEFVPTPESVERAESPSIDEGSGTC